MKSKKVNWGHVIVFIILILCMIVTLLPFVWMILTSLKTQAESICIPLKIFPEKPLFSNYAAVFTKIPFAKMYLNTAVTATVIVVVQLIIPGLFSAFGTFLMRQFFMALPNELEDAARIDGCNHFMIFSRIMFPLVKPGLLALAILTLRSAWNDLMWPMIVNTSPEKMTLSAGLSYLQGQYATDYSVMMAGAVLAVLPLLILFALFQKQFIEGIALQGIKG